MESILKKFCGILIIWIIAYNGLIEQFSVVSNFEIISYSNVETLRKLEVNKLRARNNAKQSLQFI